MTQKRWQQRRRRRHCDRVAWSHYRRDCKRSCPDRHHRKNQFRTVTTSKKGREGAATHVVRRNVRHIETPAKLQADGAERESLYTAAAQWCDVTMCVTGRLCGGDGRGVRSVPML